MQKLLAPAVLSIAALAPTGRAQQLVRSVAGPAAGALFGKTCIRVADQNADGIDDVLVGAPGFNQQRGAIYCVSGAYLASGTGAQTLWSIAPSVGAGARFGFALADVGDVTGDGVEDFLVGEPGYDAPGGSIDGGAVRLVDGSSHALVSLIFDHDLVAAFGSAIAVVGDTTGDGKKEVVVGAPGPAGSHAAVFAIEGAHLATNSDVASIAFFSPMTFANEGMGASLASGFDIDADGNPEVIVGEPGYSGSGLNDEGRVRIYSLVHNTGYFHWNDVELGVAGERFGASLSAAHDYDGDGKVDIVVGAPNTPGVNNTEPGRAVVLSGARVILGALPYELYTLTFAGSGPLPTTNHFGAAVYAGDDLNGDGVGDIVVGAPDYSTLFPFGPAKGNVSIFSGATRVRIAEIAGNNNDRLGDALSGAIGDLDHDGFPDFAVAGSLSDAGGTDSGVVKAYRLFPCAAQIYCTGKLNSLGCTPAISFNGSPSASSSAPFLITASSFINHKNGLLFYSNRPSAVPFQAGTKCAQNPTVHTPPQNSGGSTSGSDCTGTYSFDFNAWSANGWDATLGAGDEIFAQYWSRDPASASPTSLSNALRFLINP